MHTTGSSAATVLPPAEVANDAWTDGAENHTPAKGALPACACLSLLAAAWLPSAQPAVVWRGGAASCARASSWGRGAACGSSFSCAWPQSTGDGQTDYNSSTHAWPLSTEPATRSTEPATRSLAACACLPSAEGSYSARKMAGVRAYHEWMPTRVAPKSDGVAFYRSFQFGECSRGAAWFAALSARRGCWLRRPGTTASASGPPSPALAGCPAQHQSQCGHAALRLHGLARTHAVPAAHDTCLRCSACRRPGHTDDAGDPPLGEHSTAHACLLCSAMPLCRQGCAQR